MRGRLITWFVVLFTLVLAGVAIFTAVKLYQQRQVSVAPTAPTSIPRAAETTTQTTACQTTSFSITASKCGDACTTNTDCPTDHTCSSNKCVLSSCLVAGATCDTTNCTQVTPASCNNTCDANTPCSSGLTCVSGACRNPSCTAQTGCVCATPTPTPTPAPTAAPGCGDTCTASSQCPTDHTCSGNKCVLTTCLTSGVTCNSANCSVVTATATPAPSLPVAGNGTPTIIFGVLGFLAIVGALALVF